MMVTNNSYKKYGYILIIPLLLIMIFTSDTDAQYQANWLSGGSLHNWYSEIGSEVEVGLRPIQQYGMRWPGMFAYQDMQAAKALWIGARNYTDVEGTTWNNKVVHIGPRVSGATSFYPVEFKTYGRYELPALYVDGLPQISEAPMELDEIDADLPSDFMIYNRVNSSIGLTMERRIYQFSGEGHDNYHITEYTFTNTGMTDGTEEVHLPDQVIEDVVFFFQYRLAPVRETRYLIGNHTGWGRNTMLDARGVPDIDPDDVDFRAQFAWHGYDPDKEVPYNNIGVPIFHQENIPSPFIDVADTVGRLGAPHFGGVVTIHADSSPTDPSDDASQPSTTQYVDSGHTLNSGNDPFNPTRMRQEYDLMTEGHADPRHAWRVEPSGNFDQQTSNPSLGGTSGFSIGNGYGPYTIGPGESVRIVIGEGVSGLSRETALAIGSEYKNSGADDEAAINYNGTAMTKNQWVMTGRDSLFQTFERAIENFESDYTIVDSPMPPSTFSVESGGDRISISWERPAGDLSNIVGYRIYRARDRYDGDYVLIADENDLGPNERIFDDTDPLRGSEYYYYIQTVADGIDGVVTSSRALTQTFDPAFLRRPAGESLADIRVVPNPFDIRAATHSQLGWHDREQDRLYFLDIPGNCQINIYTELGELIETIDHNDGTGDAMWDMTTSARQVIVSGVYIAHFTVTQDQYHPETDELLYRAGETTYRKFVIIR